LGEEEEVGDFAQQAPQKNVSRLSRVKMSVSPDYHTAAG